MSVADAARSDSERDLLVAMRDVIAAQLDAGVMPRDLASLTKRLMEIRQEISAIDAGEEGDAITHAADLEDDAWPS